jgi:hypothetical protein
LLQSERRWRSLATSHLEKKEKKQEDCWVYISKKYIYILNNIPFWTILEGPGIRGVRILVCSVRGLLMRLMSRYISSFGGF